MGKKLQRKAPSRVANGRQALAMELVDIPVLTTNLVTKKDRVWEELSGEFWKKHPIAEFDNLSEEELKQTLKWAQEVHASLGLELNKLENELKAEWLSKEQLLDQFLEASIGTRIR